MEVTQFKSLDIEGSVTFKYHIAVISPFFVYPCTKSVAHPEMPHDVFFFKDGCIRVDTTSTKSISNMSECPSTINLKIPDHHDDFRPLILRSTKINLTHTLDFNPETEILDRQIVSMTSDDFAYWHRGQKDFVGKLTMTTDVFIR